MRRAAPFAALSFVALGLTACNTTAPPPQSASAAMTSPDVKLPEGSDCAAVIARYRAVVESDASTGNLEQPVYRKVVKEIAPAESACAAGHDAQARAMIAASARRHGYPASL